MEEVLRDLLPDDYQYKLVTCELKEFKEDNILFTAEKRVNCSSEEETKMFLSSLNISTSCTINVATGR